MNADQWYRTGAVAKMLGTSPHRIRALAQAGVIESRLENNFRYVPKREVERLQAEGLPPLPATAEFSDEESSDDEEEAPAIPAESARRRCATVTTSCTASHRPSWPRARKR